MISLVLVRDGRGRGMYGVVLVEALPWDGCYVLDWSSGEGMGVCRTITANSIEEAGCYKSEGGEELHFEDSLNLAVQGTLAVR